MKADYFEQFQKVAAIYARTACQSQEGDRPMDIQVEFCLFKARAAGCAVPPGFIIRDVWSGLDLERHGLTQLRNLARSGKLQVLYVFSADRLSRDLGDLLMVMGEFEECGVRVEFVQGRREDLDNMRLMIS